LALPLVISGLRSATLQVVATATIAAYVSAGGLGRLLISGQATANYSEMFAGAVLVAVMPPGPPMASFRIRARPRRERGN